MCITAAYELNYFSSAGLKQNKTLCDEVSYCSDMSRWTVESNEPIPRHQEEWLHFVPIYIIPAK